MLSQTGRGMLRLLLSKKRSGIFRRINVTRESIMEPSSLKMHEWCFFQARYKHIGDKLKEKPTQNVLISWLANTSHQKIFSPSWHTVGVRTSSMHPSLCTAMMMHTILHSLTGVLMMVAQNTIQYVAPNMSTGDCESHSIGFALFSCSLNYLGRSHVLWNGGRVWLEESTSIRIETFHQVISQKNIALIYSDISL